MRERVFGKNTLRPLQRSMLWLAAFVLAMALQAASFFAEGAGSAVISFGGLPASVEEAGAAMSVYRVGALKEDPADGGDSISDYRALEEYAVSEGFTALLTKTEEVTASDTDKAVKELSNIVTSGTGVFPADSAYQTQPVSGGGAVFTGLDSGVYLCALTTAPAELTVIPILFFIREAGGVQIEAKWDLVTKAAVIKNWNDDSNRDGVRPEEIYAVLYFKTSAEEEGPGQVYRPNGSAEGEADASADNCVMAVLNASCAADAAGNQWAYETEMNLPKYTDKTTKEVQYIYLWHEVKVERSDSTDPNKITAFSLLTANDTGADVVPQTIAAGYSIPELSEGTSSFDDGTNTWDQTITNSREPELTRLTVRKEWDDNLNQDGKRPLTLTVTLNESSSTEGTKTVAGYERIDLNEENEWTYTTGDLPVYKTGGVHDQIRYTWTEPYIAEYSTTGEEISADGLTTTFTNTHTPGLVSSSVQKNWLDNNNQDGIRPSSVTVVLEKKNGEDGEWADCTDPKVSQVLNDENEWKYTQEKLEEYTGGKKNYYRWREEPFEQAEGHTPYDDPVITESGSTIIIDNPHTPETVEETVTKVWAGETSGTTYRPAEISVRLMGSEDLGIYRLNAGNNWTVTVEKLPKYANGREINYVWTEVQTNTDRYRSTTPVRNAETRTTTITNTYIPRISINVSKSWSDSNNEDGSRPGAVTVRLLADGTPQGAEVMLSASSNPAWSYTWTDLPSTDLSGTDIVYTVEETDVPAGYTSRLSGSEASGFVITNSHTPERGSLRITKRVTLNGAATTGTAVDGTYEFTITGPHDYAGTARITIIGGAASSTTINDLPVGTYTIRETVPDGTTLVGENDLTANVTANNTANMPEVVFVNNRTQTPPPPETEPPTEPDLTGSNITISGTKFWEDEGNRYGTRPSGITVRLYANGALVSSNPTWTSTAGNSWSYTFGLRPAQDANGRTISYTVQEEAVAGYRTSVSGYNITNTLIPQTPESYTTISGTKAWADSSNALGTRPNVIIVRLFRNGTEVESRNVTAATGWTYSFQSVPVDDGYGNRYNYTIREDGVPGYYARVNGNDIVNSKIPEDLTGGSGRPETPAFEELSEENLEQLLDLYDYNTPLFGGLLGTGDKMPIYPFIFGGIGVAAVLLLIIFGRRRKEEDAAK